VAQPSMQNVDNRHHVVESHLKLGHWHCVCSDSIYIERMPSITVSNRHNKQLDVSMLCRVGNSSMLNLA
jgi:hypothetical protein